MAFNRGNTLCPTLWIELEEKIRTYLRALIHNLWIIVWIFALIYCKSVIISLLL